MIVWVLDYRSAKASCHRLGNVLLLGTLYVSVLDHVYVICVVGYTVCLYICACCGLCILSYVMRVCSGCATESQCDYNVDPTTGALVGTPAGMTIYPSCCAAGSFPNDDTIAIDYSKVCNSAHSHMKITPLFIVITMICVGITTLF